MSSLKKKNQIIKTIIYTMGHARRILVERGCEFYFGLSPSTIYSDDYRLRMGTCLFAVGYADCRAATYLTNVHCYAIRCVCSRVYTVIYCGFTKVRYRFLPNISDGFRTTSRRLKIVFVTVDLPRNTYFVRCCILVRRHIRR